MARWRPCVLGDFQSGNLAAMKAILKTYGFLLAFGLVAVMATWNLLVMRTLWHDEAMLANNLLARSFAGMLKPLNSQQAGPIGFLLLEKLCGLLGGYSNLSLRIVPFFGFLIGWLGLYGGLREVFSKRRGWPELMALLYGLTYTPLRYAVEVKQYTFDTMVWAWALWGVAALLSGKLSVLRRDHRMLLASVGVLMLLLSNVAFLILFGAGLTWFSHLLKQKNQREIILALGTMAVWVFAFTFYYLAFIYKHPAQSFMVNYWSKADAFMPLNADVLNWLPSHLTRLFRFLFHAKFFGFKHLYLLVFLSAWGWIRMGRKSLLFLFFLLPLLSHLLLSGLELYPFQGRLALWHLPGILLGLGGALYSVGTTSRHPAPSLLLALLVCINFSNTLRSMPDTKFDLQPILAFLRSEAAPHQRLFHSHSVNHVLHFEEAREPGLPNFEDAKIGNWNTRVISLDQFAVATDTSYYLSYAIHSQNADSVQRWCRDHGRSIELVVSHKGSELYRMVNNP